MNKSKVKVTQTIADELQYLSQTKKTKGEHIEYHVMNRYSLKDKLSSLSVDELIRALYIGYEVIPEFVEGDIVTVNWSDTGKKMYKLVGVDGDEVTMTDEKVQIIRCTDTISIRHATPEEVEQRKLDSKIQWWRGNGRKVGELKVGDIIKGKGYLTGKLRAGVYLGDVMHRDYRRHKLECIESGVTREITSHSAHVVCFVKDRKDWEDSRYETY